MQDKSSISAVTVKKQIRWSGGPCNKLHMLPTTVIKGICRTYPTNDTSIVTLQKNKKCLFVVVFYIFLLKNTVKMLQ